MKIFKKKEKPRGLSEKEVLKMLEIPDFRHMTKDKVMAFTSLIPQMDAEVAKTALRQFPDFARTACKVMDCYKELMGSVLKENALSTKEFNESCDTVIAALNALLAEKKIKFKDKKHIIDCIMQILEMKKDKDSENKEWHGKFIAVLSASALAILGIASAILGVKFLDK